ncbi:hypothetical protein E3E12_07600 [Formicincola oecophyllae]|uniref:Uncharacterized protein n=1 Tax=Formicincola oecophyllae TaxID=2558361 RepID=A0A4Y6U9K0_9PROT|nr:hypothetical protein [Formicincola oecophyllae]QDH14062.1 hypothetical protein E3E12_07600 [Formicincola oecophyllae]
MAEYSDGGLVCVLKNGMVYPKPTPKPPAGKVPEEDKKPDPGANQVPEDALVKESTPSSGSGAGEVGDTASEGQAEARSPEAATASATGHPEEASAVLEPPPVDEPYDEAAHLAEAAAEEAAVQAAHEKAKADSAKGEDEHAEAALAAAKAHKAALDIHRGVLAEHRSSAR